MTAIARQYFPVALRAILAVALAVVLVPLGPAGGVRASGNPGSGSLGFDMSYPQCGAVGGLGQINPGTAYQFAILGVNHGRPFSQNPCLAAEYQLASARGMTVSLYMNLDFPRSDTRLTGTGAAVAQGCAAGDEACASYNYGWYAAQDAYASAARVLGSLGAASVPGSWWIDIEVANYWSPDPSMNVRVIQGAIDFFQETVGQSTVGIYSIGTMWTEITGADYRPGVPVWLAGAHSLAMAGQLCTAPSLTGGPITLVQYATPLLDLDYAC
jgi:hypothetical protein